MSEPTFYQEAPMTNRDARQRWVVPVVRCEHGNIDPHVIGFEDEHDAQGYAVPVMCPGAGIGDNDED